MGADALLGCARERLQQERRVAVATTDWRSLRTVRCSLDLYLEHETIRFLDSRRGFE